MMSLFLNVTTINAYNSVLFVLSFAGDSMAKQNGQMFSTKDQDNDIHSAVSCAQSSHGAWWYEKCHNSNLNGLYGSIEEAKGLTWHTWKGSTHSMLYTAIMVKKGKSLRN